MYPETILITNANQGIGLDLINYIITYQNPPPRCLIAACNSLSEGDEERLGQMMEAHDYLKKMLMDTAHDSGIDEAVYVVKELLQGRGINLLICNAGQVHDGGFTLVDQTRPNLNKYLEIGGAVPVMVAQKFFPLLKKASQIKCAAPLGCNRAAIINMSFQFCSVHTSGDTMRSYYYRAARAALSTVSQMLAIELKEAGILVAAIHPGWSDTGASENSVDEDVLDTVKKLWLTMTSLCGHSAGMIYNYDGMILPW
ncbi:hypothetical protein ACOMHN_065179 [Nucella lapillus]